MDKLFSHSKKSVNYIKGISWGDEHFHDEFSFKNQRHVVLSVLLVGFVIAVNVLFFSLKNTVLKTSANELPSAPLEQYEVKVLSLRYFPTTTPEASGSAQVFDASRTGMPGGTTLEGIRARVDMLRDKTVGALHEATKYHGYKNPAAQPSLQYQVIDEKEFLKPIPVAANKSSDKFKVFTGTDPSEGISNICDYIENQGVKEVWVWFYHTTEVYPIESNMAPKTGGEYGTEGYKDVSNSPADNDLPRCAKTYTVYDFNYTRDVSLHNFGHHLESIFRYVDSDVFTNYMYRGTNGTVNACGNVHHPPNIDYAEGQGDSLYHDDYDYSNEQTRQSSCQNWRPDGTGLAEPVNCHSWQGSGECNNWDEVGHLKYQQWWMQNMPGMNNGLTYKGKPMPNWWKYIGDWDNPANQKPSVRITNLQPGFVATSNFSINVEASHPSGIEKVEFYVNDQQTPIATSATAPYTATLNLNQMPRGEMTISAKATIVGQGFGGVGETSLHGTNNYVDKNPPMVRIKSPKFGEVLTDNKVKFEYESVDDVLVGRIYGQLESSEPYNIFPGKILAGNFDANGKSTETHILPDGVYRAFYDLKDHYMNSTYVEHMFVVKADPDNDTFTTKLEDFMGTSSLSHCGTNAWPPDFNNDKIVNPSDQGLLAANYATKGSVKYNKRYDFNMDGAVNVADMGLFFKYVNKRCSGPTALIQPIVTYPVEVSCTYYNFGFTSNNPNGDYYKMFISAQTVELIGGNFQFLGAGEVYGITTDVYGGPFHKCTNSHNFTSNP